jgi:hypothetical protein
MGAGVIASHNNEAACSLAPDGQPQHVPAWRQAVTSNDPYLQQILAGAYDSPNRPRCMCTSGGVEMYIAKYGQFFIKRMPGTGSDHCASCDSYEPSASDSGLGYMLGEAVVEKGPELVEVRSDFPLDRFDGRTIARADPAEKSSVTSKHKKLTIRGLQHLIWERAGFNRWTPNMKDKRGWGVIRKYSMEAAEGIELKGMRLSERLYVAEPFRSEDSD